MLKHLKVKNFALINQLEISIDDGLSVITGETGAGKSILLGALRLILGERADHASLMNEQEKCVVEGVFAIKGYPIADFFNRHDLDFWEETVLRREVSPQGKSRSFINDTPVTLSVMKEIGGYLVDLHSQHQSLQLNEARFQLEVIDAIANTEPLRNSYRKLYKDWSDKQKDFEKLIKHTQEAKRDQDYWQFQYDELEALDYNRGEEAELSAEQEILANSEELSQFALQISGILEDSEPNAMDLLKQANGLIEQVARYLPKGKPLSKRFQSSLIEIEDIKRELLEELENIEHDPNRLEWLEDRLAEIHRLKKKHQFEDADELLELKENLNQKLLAVNDSELILQKSQKEIQNLKSLLIEKGTELSQKRNSSLTFIEKSVRKSLQNLAINKAELKIEHQKLDEPSPSGLDGFNFLFSANQGIAPQKLANTASGGEVSRLVLSVKTLLAEKKQMPTILFDEIDTGVSGEVAEKMGQMLANMAKNRQVIAITHLPQIAAKGKQHFFVYKNQEAGKTNSKMKLLNETERIHEVAKMLSGSKTTEAAMINAKELLQL